MDMMYGFYNSFFNNNVCHVCKKFDAPLKTCSNCKTVVYCSKEHQKVDWKNHKAVCSAISKTNSLLDHFSLNSYEDYVLRKELSSKMWKETLGRDLLEYEMQMAMFPRVCEICFSNKVMMNCNICHNVCYCSDSHKRSHYEQHKKHCAELKLNLELEIEFYKTTFGDDDEVIVNDFSDNLNILPSNLYDLMLLYDKTFPTGEDQKARMIRRANFVAPAATILYGLESGGFLPERVYCKEDLVVHIVGAGLTETGWLWKEVTELPFHWIRNLKNLEYIVIGPELGYENTTDKFTRQMCKSCKDKNVKTQLTFHNQLYHNIVNSVKYPDLVVALNCGLHEHQGEPEKDTWKDSLSSLLQYSGVPLILTSYTSDEISQDLHLVTEDVSHVIKSKPHRNPFSNMMPLRNFDNQFEPVYYSNGYITVLVKN